MPDESNIIVEPGPEDRIDIGVRITPTVETPGNGSGIEGSGGEPEIIGGYETAEPGSTVPVGEPVKRRGRKPGSKNRASATGSGAEAEKASGSLIDLTYLLASVHAMGAALLQVPELEIAEEEAKRYADAVTELSKHYTKGILSPKQIAWLNFLAVTGNIYGTRVLAYRLRKKMEAKDKPAKLIQMQTGRPAQAAPPVGAERKQQVNGGVLSEDVEKGAAVARAVFGFEEPKEDL
jgi:hypothetical protein